MFWSGAGISGDRPACLPLGDDLTEAIVSATCSRRTWDCIGSIFEQLEMRDDSGRIKVAPRLEAVIEQLDRRAGGRITQALRMLASVEPNDLHAFFAAHIADGGRHVTMNFDERIEACCTRLVTQHRPVALHGRVTASGDGSVRTRTSDLAHGVEPKLREAVVRRLAQGGTLVFVGYSGRDYFDVDPFFRSLVRRQLRLTGLTAIWLSHRRDGEELVEDWESREGLDGKPILECLKTLGAAVIYQRANTRSFLRELSEAWPYGVCDGEELPPCPERSSLLDALASELRTDVQDQLYYTADLCAAMALAPPVLDLEPQIPDAVHALSDAHSRVGNYRRAISYAKAGRDRAQAASQAAALQRLRGAYVRSLLGHLRALRLLYARENDEPPLRGAAQIEYVNWYAGARRTAVGPVVAFTRQLLCSLTPIRLTQRLDPVALFWRLADDTDVLDAHPHSIAQLKDVYEGVPEVAAGGPVPESIALRHREGAGAYVETDSVTGYINATRSELRRALGRGDDVARADLERHLDRCRCVCDRPGEVKAQLLLRRAGYAAEFPAGSLRSVEWTRLSKLLWITRWLAAPVARRLAVGRGIGTAP